MKKQSVIALLLVLMLLVTSCTKPTPAPAPAPESGKYTAGTYTATVKGFGGDVTVNVTVDANDITDVKVEGPGETANIGTRAIEELPDAIIAANSAEVDVVSGATVTSDAIIAAVGIALAEAGGEKLELKLNDGTYEASANGFSLMQPVPVKVVVSGGKMTEITVGESGETMGMIASVEDLLIPRIIEHQSVGVDAIVGATSTSNAVKAAVLDCAVQAGGTVGALSAKVALTPSADEAYEVDVVVVGMGGSGTMAALAAAEAGKTVFAIDKAGKWAGTSVITSGPMVVNAPSQVNAEIPDWTDPITKEKRTKAAGEKLVDADALYEDWINYTTVNGVQGAKTDIIRKTIDLSGETADWMTTHGFAFNPAGGFVGGKWGVFSAYTGNKALTESYFAAVYEKFSTKLGGKYLLETEATELIMENGRVAGIRAVKLDGTKVTIKAKSVILATGGFAGNTAMKNEYIGGDWKPYAMTQNDGAGIKMALSAGAATYNINILPMSHFVAPSVITTAFGHEDNDIPYGLICTAEALAVNAKGERFINESIIAMEGFIGGPEYYTIYSKEQIDILKEKGLSFDASGRYLTQGGVKADTPLSNIDAVIGAGLVSGEVFKGGSLGELAAAIGGMQADALKASVEAYGEAAKGADPLGKAADRFARLGAPAMESEYYVAFAGSPYIYSTCAGVDVNENMQVLNAGGNVIEGLYAVGTDSMGVLFTDQKGYTNYGGVAQGYAFVSGRIAGEHAAK